MPIEAVLREQIEKRMRIAKDFLKLKKTKSGKEALKIICKRWKVSQGTVYNHLRHLK